MTRYFKNFRFVHISILFLVFLVGFEFVSLVVYRPHPPYGLEGRYFDNTEWQGTPSIIALDSNISSETLRIQRENLPQNRYSVEWTGYIDILETEAFTFSLESDDGSWLFIDDTLVVDNGGIHGLIEKEGSIHLRQGIHRIKIRYFQAGGYAVLRVFWKRGEKSKQALEHVYLFPPDTNRFYLFAKNYFPFIIMFAGVLILIVGNWALTKNTREE